MIPPVGAAGLVRDVRSTVSGISLPSVIPIISAVLAIRPVGECLIDDHYIFHSANPFVLLPFLFVALFYHLSGEIS